MKNYRINSDSAFELASILIDASLCNDFARKFIVEHLIPMDNCYYSIRDLGEFYETGSERMRTELIERAIEYVEELGYSEED